DPRDGRGRGCRHRHRHRRSPLPADPDRSSESLTTGGLKVGGLKGRILSIAGSDSGGGAGIQADIKTIAALGGYAMTAVTAVTVQDTLGVTNVHAIPPAIVREQIEAVMSDLGADTWKIGMMGSAAHVRTV